MGNIITTKEVMVGLGLPPDITSIERYRMIMNDSRFREKNGISNLVFRNAEELFYADLGLPHLLEGQLKRGRVRGELLSQEPLVVAYTDGGFEYLEKFLGQATDSPVYDNKIFIPNISATLSFSHPIKNRRLIELFNKG